MISSVICWSRKLEATQPPAIAEEDSSVRLSATRSFRRRMGGLLHPERESQSALDELKTSMGTMEFSAQYQQAPVPAGGNLIKWSWFKFYDQPPASLPSEQSHYQLGHRPQQQPAC